MIFTTTGINNTSVGRRALEGNTTGSRNTAVGSYALYSSSTTNNNTAVGHQALYANTTGTDNTAVGYATLDVCTTGYNNVAVGGAATYQAAALGSVTTGYNNVGIGAGAGSVLTTASSCTMVGRLSGYSTSGGNNTFIGEQAGYLVTTGAINTIIGRFTGNSGGLNITTSSNYVVLADGSGNYSAYGTGGAWYKANNTSTWSTVSDGRIKENIVPLSSGLDKILALNPVEFDYILSGDHDVSFIAQEYREVLPDQVVEQTAISDEIKALTNNEPLLGLETNLVPYLVKAIQEQQATITALQARIEALENV